MELGDEEGCGSPEQFAMFAFESRSRVGSSSQRMVFYFLSQQLKRRENSLFRDWSEGVLF